MRENVKWLKSNDNQCPTRPELQNGARLFSTESFGSNDDPTHSKQGWQFYATKQPHQRQHASFGTALTTPAGFAPFAGGARVQVIGCWRSCLLIGCLCQTIPSFGVSQAYVHADAFGSRSACCETLDALAHLCLHALDEDAVRARRPVRKKHEFKSWLKQARLRGIALCVVIWIFLMYLTQKPANLILSQETFQVFADAVWQEMQFCVLQFRAQVKPKELQQLPADHFFRRSSR